MSDEEDGFGLDLNNWESENVKKERPLMHCGECMSEGIHPDARRCPHCGVPFETEESKANEAAMLWVFAAILCFGVILFIIALSD